MGGLAIKKVIGREGRRINSIEKEKFQEIISSVLEVTFIPEVQEKNDFGDIDILIDSNLSNKIENILKNEFKDSYQGVVRNSNIWSFAIDSVQIDFILTPKDKIEISRFYFSNNDMGNLIGNIAKSIGLKFGHHGLILPVFEINGNIQTEITLSTIPKDILKFLRFPKPQLEIDSSFISFYSMYNFIASSELFNGSIYGLEKLNNENRTRNSKRSTWMNFLKWMDSNPEYKNKKPRHPIQNDYWRNKAIINFGVEKEYVLKTFKMNQKEFIREKFNGEIVSRLTGFTNEKLGAFIKAFKKRHQLDYEILSFEEVENFILTYKGEEYEKNKPT